MKIIFLNSYSPRTGHNFIAQVIKCAIDCKIIPHEHAETRLTLFLQKYFELKSELLLNQTAAKFMDLLFVDNIKRNIKENFSDNFLMIKDTNQNGVKHLQNLFPDDLHILMFRDPRDTLVSIFKGMRFHKKRKFKDYLKTLGYKTGLYSFYYSRKYSKRFIKSIPENIENFHVIKYENIVKRDDESLMEILVILDSSLSLQEFKSKINGISVINTSFHQEETGGKHIWDPKERTSNFNPVNRKKIPYLHRKGIELGSKKFRKKLGYL